MGDQENNKNVEQIVFTKAQVDEIVAAVPRRVRESQSGEAEQRSKGFDIPTEIIEELDGYSSFELVKALQKFKRSVPRYNKEDWNTPKSTNLNFVTQLKLWKIDSLPIVSTIYKLTEITRVQARAAAEIYESLRYII
ncbi:hypothetical protein J3Q64DRAFT_1834977 [Phycomyces blakesleeanus]|uniref:Uncharacterized protein n=2 Tax=Phycomyces blakesleeanus TaxID=4837 RepID=A0A163DSI0_PHYB8|nr:hypothetical protein PHYBLDRAFT_145566 [Phycomyces blakesleeanus NRRL 1555(-)]OAD73160.1 hypothetical protein PHYBLDRAFT_145566 [Phycomyces blakesleeanus NRRL 1555(-)]|eukprot:XP_018291200.1 hypothetical protein PHYBLDRAFT_145566 [Phycomyces blakesleeanus NRRL 1555(-)]